MERFHVAEAAARCGETGGIGCRKRPFEVACTIAT